MVVEKAAHESRRDVLLLKYFDSDDDNTCPGKRFYLLVLLGILTSIIVMEISSDEYYAGQRRRFGQVRTKGKYDHWNSSQFDLSFYNLKCIVASREEGSEPEKVILNRVTGRIHSGRLTSILGQSGSGKSTLMQKLLGRTKSFCSKEEGDIFVNGRIAWNGLESLIDLVGYVPQHDVLYSELSVYETIMFSANWRLPKSFGKEEKEELVSRILNILDLEEIRNKMVGDLVNHGSGYHSRRRRVASRLSGGERKRISIAVELVSLPKILLMDEPTSGLDSASALSLMNVLKDISRLGVTVVAIVHQPSERIFRLSEDVIVLQKGETAYIGPHSQLEETLIEFGYFHDNLGSAETVLDIMAGLVKPSDYPRYNFLENIEYYLSELSPGVSPEIENFRLDDIVKCATNKDSQFCYNSMTGMSHPRLPVLFRIKNRLERRMRKTSTEAPKASRVETSWYRREADGGRSARPGFKTQFNLWLALLGKLELRKQLGVEITSIIGLAVIVGFVSGYNRSWSRKPMNNMFLSLSIGLIGALSTVYSDDMDPVRRAADSGMILGAHELALLVHNLFKGWIVCHIFSLSFFGAFFVKTNSFILEDYEEVQRMFSWRKFHKYYQFAHINHLNYAVTSAAGSAICVCADHDLALCNVLAICFLITCHVFAAFSPNKNQLRKDSVVFGYDFSSFFVALSKLSYVTYYLEAIFLWDEDPINPRGRRLTMRYYAYQEHNKTWTCHCMFGLWTLYQILRFLVFVKKNSNEYHSINDTPYFFAFALKVFTVHIVGWVLMSLIQDIYIPFVTSLRRRHH